MVIAIDPSEKQKIRLISLEDKKEKIYLVRNRELLACLDTFLEQEKKTVRDLKGIAVVVGSGSFSDTRVAVTVANALAYACTIPVIGVSVDDIKKHSRVLQMCKKAKKGVYLSATYSAEPNIGPPK